MNTRPILSCIVALGIALSLPAAAAPEAIDGCVDLGADRTLRHNGAQFLYVRDGEQHYRFGFRDGRCNAMTMTSKLKIATDGKENRVCPGTARLKAKGLTCLVTVAETISAEDYERRLRRR
jgi:hypothetical protein